jgi:holo-[acyl-carrier protein] synthase
MRVIGLGNDMVDIRRIAKSLVKWDEKFKARVFTEIEMARSDKKSGDGRAASYAKRWAAKEACSKALGLGIRGEVTFKSIGIENDDLGRPYIVLSEGARDQLNEITPEGMTAQINLTISDEYPYAQAIVLITAL